MLPGARTLIQLERGMIWREMDIMVILMFSVEKCQDLFSAAKCSTIHHSVTKEVSKSKAQI